MALTMAEYAKQAYNDGNLLLGNIADWFLMESNVLQLIPWATDKRLAVQIVAQETLPSVSWRRLNAAFSESTGKFQQKIESKFIFGHDIDVDIVLARAGDTVGDVRQNQRKMSAKAMAFEFNDQFINGDPSTDEFKGISKRVDDVNSAGYTDQYFDAGSATIGRGVLYNTTERHYFIDQVAKLIHVISEHKPDALFMNSKLYLCFESAMRRESLLKQTEDMFGRIINTFQQIPLIDIGIKADQSTEIITNAEILSGGTDETSIYAVKYGVEEYMWGIQQEPLQVRDLGEIDTKPVYRDRVEWVVGLAVSNPRAIARAYGFVADSGAS
ncbi:hypothetical protein LCGC14_1863260 [marine sediment metagenome]|uniref:Uncharacterized protein n=1 Tax=marine sediment metagenome TaxID=412755 RepID=A0A0F9J5T9_9ZZZZ